MHVLYTTAALSAATQSAGVRGRSRFLQLLSNMGPRGTLRRGGSCSSLVAPPLPSAASASNLVLGGTLRPLFSQVNTLTSNWERFAGIVHFHHHNEDALLFPWLETRAPAEALKAMSGEHEARHAWHAHARVKHLIRLRPCADAGEADGQVQCRLCDAEKDGEGR